MGSDVNRRELDDYAIRLIRHKAKQLVGQFGFSRDDRLDIEQDLTVDLLARLPKYDSSHATLHTFVVRVLDHKIARMIEERSAALRDYRRAGVSLNEPVKADKEGGEERGDLLDMNAYLRMMGTQTAPVADRAALRVDLDRAMARLTSGQRALCAELIAGKSVTDIARELGIHRDTVYERLKQIRGIFRDAGLEDYL